MFHSSEFPVREHPTIDARWFSRCIVGLFIGSKGFSALERFCDWDSS